MNGYNNDMIANSIAADASNIRSGGNPEYTVSDFLAMYPGFGNNSAGVPIVPTVILQVYVDLGLTCIQQARYHGAWSVAIGYFVAHFATLWLQSTADPNGGATAVIAAGQARGLVTSEAANDLSISMDYTLISNDLEGWAAWKITQHGQNLATLAKLYGKGGMVIR